MSDRGEGGLTAFAFSAKLENATFLLVAALPHQDHQDSTNVDNLP